MLDITFVKLRVHEQQLNRKQNKIGNGKYINPAISCSQIIEKEFPFLF
jgi:hypothetical protein